MDIEALRLQLNKYNQKNILKFWEELAEDERCKITNDLLDINLSEVTSYFLKATESSRNNNKILDDEIEPIDDDNILYINNCNDSDLNKYQDIGLNAISMGKIGVVLMAGGQGTRLGVSYPKGMYDVGLPSHKTLFQLQAERIKRLEIIAKEKYGYCKGITWYILTSEATHESTLNYFKENNYFNLDENNVKAFKQGMLPCFGFDGSILLDEKYRISKAPDGNGGLYRALKVEGILDDMIKRDIQYVHAHSVDNILIKVADPIFMGYCIDKKADCGVKVIEKTDPTEPVGVVCQVYGQYRVVEYSEISKKTSELKQSNGKLVYNAANICNHFFTVHFLENIVNNHEHELDLHIAKKKIPYIDDNGIKIIPNCPNGIKIEKFIFDVFKFSTKFVAFQTTRQDEFSPLKNSDSANKDCPSTARQHLLALHKKWLLKAGAKDVQGQVEISPLKSYSGENLTDIPQIIVGPIILY